MNVDVANDEVVATHELTTQGTTVYAYYDSNADTPGPSQIVIEADVTSMNSESDFFFTVDGRFKRLEIENFYGYKCTQLSVNDLKYRDGLLCIDFPTISKKYGRAAKRFVLQMKHVEDLIKFEECFF